MPDSYNSIYYIIIMSSRHVPRPQPSHQDLNVIHIGKPQPKRECNPDNAQAKVNGGKNSTTNSVSNAAKIERNEASGEKPLIIPVIPDDVRKLIQQTRIEKGFKTQKDLAMQLGSSNITVADISEIENGKFIMNQNNRTKCLAVCRKLGLKVELPKF